LSTAFEVQLAFESNENIETVDTHFEKEEK
jgi:hypothetical protein